MNYAISHYFYPFIDSSFDHMRNMFEVCSTQYKSILNISGDIFPGNFTANNLIPSGNSGIINGFNKSYQNIALGVEKPFDKFMS